MSWLDGWRDLDGFCGWESCVFGVGACGKPGNVVTGFEIIDVTRADREDSAFCFAAEDFGLGRGVEAGAEIAALGVSGIIVRGKGG